MHEGLSVNGMAKEPITNDLVRERVVIVTDQDVIEGTICYPRGVRLSDALNAENAQLSKPHLPLVDATVTRIDLNKELLHSRFLLVARSKIVVLMPKSEILASCSSAPPEPEPAPLAKTPVRSVPLRRESDVPTLMQALNHPDEMHRRKAAEGLGRLGSRAKVAIPALLECLKDKDDLVRGQSAEALGSIGLDGRSDTITAMRALLKDMSEFVRRMAAGALGSFGSAAAEAVPELSEALRDREEFVRRAAADALGKIGARASQAAPALQAALSDNDVFVRHWAAVALNKIVGVKGPALKV